MRNIDIRSQELQHEAKIVVSSDLILPRPIYLNLSLCNFLCITLSEEILQIKLLSAIWVKKLRNVFRYIIEKQQMFSANEKVQPE